jgi:nucleoside-diphosphate-sugar epimerase
MIVGSGFIAKNFKKNNLLLKKYKIAIYASGVSNSQSKNNNNFSREKKKLLNYKKKLKSKILIYISSCSIYDPSRNSTPYIKHKINMENLVKKNFNKFIIFRFPEVVGFNSNKNNLINFFYINISRDKKFKLWINAKRNIIDIDDAIKLCLNYIKVIKKDKKINLEINIANKIFFSVANIIKVLEKLTCKKALYETVKIGNLNWKIKPLVANKIIKMSNITFDRYYLEKVLKKYYP